MTLLKRTNLIYITAFAIRLAMFNFPSVANTLADRIELSTPITSFKRLTEGIYLYNHNVPPYDGDAFHQLPLLLCLFSFIMSFPFSNTIPFLYSTVDIIIAYALSRIAQLKENTTISPSTVAALYLFNPLTILSCVSRSTIIFTNFSMVLSLLSALKGHSHQAMFWIALGAYQSLYPIMLVPVLIMILNNNISIVGSFVVYLTGLFAMSRLYVGSWSFIRATYGIILFLSDLTPNVGMFWYFFIEIFDQFRSFFMVAFQFHMFIFTAPICIRLRKQPIFAMTVLCSIMAIFKSYPSAGDAAFYLSLVSMHDELFKYCRYGFLVSNLFLYASVLAPIFWHLWIYAGSGNANFFYAITLVYNLGQVLLLIDLVYAALRREFDLEHPESIGKLVIHK
ncbi:GPI transamidase component-like protein [Cokeromyces recurvatus]|uniref:GPI transamidase component-like protein n=1 Tax=Cokeromyces recurvatus TaxID=90255 RepID=UPI00221E9563|nr:GPI transamidase component-like protein [Cokeromyces recurvatus]KAI7902863.1 GPI transamidase component-like protein [Cokeromyces recurvatus]